MNITILLSGTGIIIALFGMSILIFKKISPVIAGPLAAIIVCITSKLPLVDTVINTYAAGVGNFFISYFFIFLLGNIFGNIYEITGASTKIGEIVSKYLGPKNCMLACMLTSAILSYGGINSFVIIFAVYPIALKLFEDADYPTYLLPGIVCGGMWTFAMTGPFTPQISNIVSMDNLGTSSYAGLIPGAFASLAMAILIVLYMNYQGKKAKAAGEHFERPSRMSEFNKDTPKPSGIKSFFPIIFIVLLFNITNIHIAVCLAIGIILAITLFWKYIPEKELINTFNSSASSFVTVIINTAVIVGFGAVAKITPFYSYAISILKTSTANPYVVAAVGSNVFAGILGSASGGLSLMMATLKDTFLSYGSQGYNLEFIHRLCSFGSGGLDSLPWNGSIVSVFSICETTHDKSYKYNFVTCCVIPVICTFFIALPLCVLLG